MKRVLSIIASAAILAFASPALAATPVGSAPIDATYYADYGIILIPCDIGPVTEQCELDTGSGWAFAIDATEAQQAGLPQGAPVAVNGASGEATVYNTTGTIALPGLGTTAPISGDIMGEQWHPLMALSTFTSLVGPIFAVNPTTDTVYGTGRETRIYRPIRFTPTLPGPSGWSVDFPCQIGTWTTTCELDTGTYAGLLMSPSEAAQAGLPLGTPSPISGVSGQTSPGYVIAGNMTTNGLAPVALTGYASTGYSGPVIVGDAYLKALYPGGYVVNTTDGVISALLAGAR